MRLCYELSSKPDVQYSLLNEVFGVSLTKKGILPSKLVVDSPTSIRTRSFIKGFFSSGGPMLKLEKPRKGRR